MAIGGKERRRLDILRRRLVIAFMKDDHAWGDIANEIRVLIRSQGITDPHDNIVEAQRKVKERKQKHALCG